MKSSNPQAEKLEQIYTGMISAEHDYSKLIEKVLPTYRDSATNLVGYLWMRSQSIEELQLQLHRMGLSSLASSESNIKFQLEQVMRWLGIKENNEGKTDAGSGQKKLDEHLLSLLGIANQEEAVPIMVTFDTNFADDLELLCNLLENGMRVARINCAHDEKDVWKGMVNNLQKAKEQTGLPCKIYMDLAGPKIRTKISTKKHHNGKLKVTEGDIISIADDGYKGKQSKHLILCTQVGIIKNLLKGQKVLFDDGLFEAVVENVTDGKAFLKIERVSADKPVIKSDKGINFPDTDFNISPITEFDKECLPFITGHADMVGFSFVNNAADMEMLQQELAILGKADFPIIAKIETRQAVQNLPQIILQGMQKGLVGVMVARGDLAIEIGFERMSEIQDEILWICEAAHTPVIWATQVLETMHKQGIATRGEVTDAAHAAQADCVMINKGDFTVKVLMALKDILSRSRRNSLKNRRLFRQLSVATDFFEEKSK